MTSANGLLALPPLFSRTMVEASMRVPPRLKLEGAVEKSILKRAVADLVPRTIIERPKSGMRVPVHYWFQGELRRFARRRLSKRRMCRLGLFDPDYIQQIVKYDTIAVPGQRHGLKLWMLLTFLLWYEQFFGEAI
jgi:asparagine synthase (glutamine-hydrolysing)